MYLGLLNLSNLVVFGIAGLHATFEPAPEEREPRVEREWEVAFAAPPGLTDKQVADLVHAELDLPLTGPVPEWAVRRDPDGVLRLNFHTPSGPHRVRVAEAEGRLHVETVRNGLGRYLSNLHATVPRYAGPDWRIRLWSYNVEFSLWSLLAMAVSGLYLWLATRPRNRAAVNSLAGGSAVFVLLYLLTR